ncbi:MAG: phage-related protein [Cocleimonas sp.]|jgi:phage-related protein
MSMKLEPVSDAALKAFNKLPRNIKERTLKALQDVMDGRTPSMPFKPLKNLGKNIKGVMELVVNGSPAYRVVYVAKHNDTVYLLHAFTKTTNGVDKPAMEVVVNRYKEIKK